MKFLRLLINSAAIACFAVTICPLPAASAATTASLTIVANIDSSADISLSNSTGTASTITFSGAGNESVNAEEGPITVTARLSTVAGNDDTIIQVKATNLVGKNPDDVIPVNDLSFTHSTDTGGGTWFSGVLSNSWTTLAVLSSGSGLYTGDQLYNLNVPASANDDTYTAIVSYQIIDY
jgi:hypothetical protein